MKSTATRVFKRIPTVLAVLAIAFTAAAKIAGPAPIVEIYSKMGLLPMMRILGLSELVFLGLFLYRPTLKIGFLLLTAYFGGAMAVEMSHGKLFIMPAFILSLVWISAWLREKSLFQASPVSKTIPSF